MLYTTAKSSVTKVSSSLEGILDGTVREAIDLASRKPRYRGRLRPGVTVRTPYWFEIEDPGLYFIEFEIDVDMKKYYRFPWGRENYIVGWSDRVFFPIETKSNT